MGLGLAFIAGGRDVATPADNAIASVTVYNGKYNNDASLLWPQYMLTSNWCVGSPLPPWLRLLTLDARF